MAKIFISYSRSDREFVEQFVAVLRSRYGDDAIFYDLDIIVGAGWWDNILQEIADCNLFIYLLSDDALGSPYCQAEFRETLRLRKLFLPLIIKPRADLRIAPDDLEKVLRQTQQINVSRLFIDYKSLSSPVFKSIDKWQKEAPKRQGLEPLSPDPIPEPFVVDFKWHRRLLKFAQNHWKAVIAGIFAIIVTVIGGLVGRDVISDGSQTPTETPTSDPVTLAERGVTSNAEWIPYVQEFNGVLMVLVPSGCFTIGANPQHEDEQNGNEVCFNEPFWIDLT